MSKLSFRARALDASKPMPIYMAEELPDSPDYSAINRAVPQMPSGMTKEEECEHHLQRAICTGLIIPTPEVSDLTDGDVYDRIYPADYKLPRQLIHMQPFAMEQDIPDYDMDSEDEKWVSIQSRKMDLTPLQFEEMMDRLEKSSGQTVVTLNEAKALLKEDDDLIIAVFDYWLNKRLKTQHPLLLTVKTEHRLGSAANNPYLAFRRITEKMQTRKNRKNDETSYEKMLKLRRDLSRAVTLLELVKRREKTKREHLHLTIEIYEKRYQTEDFNGQILAEVSALKTTRPAFAPIFTNQFGVHQNWVNKVSSNKEDIPRKEKRQYKKRKHKLDGRSSGLDESGLRSCGNGGNNVGVVGGVIGGGIGIESNRNSRTGVLGSGLDPLNSSDDDNPFPHAHLSISGDREDDDTNDEGPFAFRRNKYCSYLPPVSGGFGNWPWCDRDEGGLADKKYRFALTSISKPTPRCIGLARRRLGRGGRVILDRYSTNMDDVWSSLDFTIHESNPPVDSSPTAIKKEWIHFRPKTPPAGHNDELTTWGLSNSSSSEDSESEVTDLVSKSSRLQETTPYPFPPEATSLCVDIEPDRPGDEAPFTSEFNISDYFSVDNLTDFDLGVITDKPTDDSIQIGCSRFQVTLNNSNVFSCRTNNSQCSVSGSSVNTSSIGATSSSSTLAPLTSSSSSSSSSFSSSTSVTVPSSSLSSTTTATTSSSTTCMDSEITSPVKQLSNQQQHYLYQQKHQQRQLNSSNPVVATVSTTTTTTPSILSKSLTTPTSSANVRVSGITNFGNGHQNGPSSHSHPNNLAIANTNINTPVQNNIGSSSHLANSQILINQKQSQGNSLPGFIAQSKYATLARQQQQQKQTQTQQVPATGEITLNSNSEGHNMEVDGVERSPCENKSQQQLRTNKTNSLAMEVT